MQFHGLEVVKEFSPLFVGPETVWDLLFRISDWNGIGTLCGLPFKSSDIRRLRDVPFSDFCAQNIKGVAF